jgi:hypothetical protein
MGQESWAMRPLHFIPLGLALAGLAYWNFSQRQSESALAAKSQALRQRITTTQKTEATTEKLKTRLKSTGQPLDWKNLAKRMVAAQLDDSATVDGVLDSFQQRMAEMTVAELFTALDEVSALGLEAEAKAILEETLVEVLIERDPGQTLVKFADRIQDESDGVGWHLAGALGQWAERDLAAATAWFDQEITAGRFESKSLDGQSEARLEFEAALIHPLLAAAPKAAAARLAALPEGQRRTALEQIDTAESSLSGQQAYMELVRELVPKDERGDALSHLISEVMPEGDYPQVTQFLNGIQATPEERTVATTTAVGNRLEHISSERAVTKDDIETMRTWLKQQSSATVDRMTGEALGQAIQDDTGLDFSQAAALVSEYHQSSGNDDLITGFLTRAAADAKNAEAIALAGKINDPKRREEALANLR